jgi:hypothetical protein
VMRDWRPDRSSSWTFVLPSLNIRRHFLTFDQFITPPPIHCNKLTVNFNRTDILCIQKPNYRSHVTLGGILDFLTTFLNTTKNRKTIESARHSLGLLLKDYWGPLTLK